MKIPKVRIQKLDTTIHQKDGVVLFVFAGETEKLDPAGRSAVGKENIDELAKFAKTRGFKGSLGDSMYLPTRERNLLLLVGLGSRKEFEQDTMRKAAAATLGLLEKMRLAHAVFVWPAKLGRGINDVAAVEAFAEGIMLGAYEFDKYLSNAKEKFSAKTIELAVRKKTAAMDKAIIRAEMISRVVNETRDLENDNSDNVNPDAFAKLCARTARENKLKISVLDGPELRRENLQLLYAVGRASQWPAKLILLEYRGDKRSKKVTALVGKGITYDTGGVQLKPSRGGELDQMHMDMSGAASVLGTLKLAAQFKLKVNIIGVLAIAENAIDGNSYKPGSVLKAYNGKTVEIANTDAEGRLVLADALAYVVKNHKPSEIIDIATLTGAVLITFGHQFAGLVSNNDQISRKLLASGERTAEKLWRLPLTDYFRSQTKGTKSDLRNLGKNPRDADTIVAAAFLEAFTDGVPFAHVDIAGTSMTPARSGYNPAGGTGFGVRLLLDYVSN